MPFDLPPPPTPLLVEREHIGEEFHEPGHGLVLQAERLRLHVIGISQLSEARVREVTDHGHTASQKIQLLNALYPAEGYPLVNIHYVRDGDTVFVLVHEGRLVDIDAPQPLGAFFSPLVGKSDLRASQLERQRTLAGIRAERAGLEVEASYRIEDADAPERFTLRLDTRDKPDHRRWRLSTAFGNPGNRFLGRYFGTVELMHATPAGHRIGTGYTRGFTSLGSGDSDQSFDRFDVKADTVNRFGLYGLTLGRTDYTAKDFSGFFPGTEGAIRFARADARINEAEVTGGQLLWADGDDRLVIEQSLGYTDSKIRATPSDDGSDEDSGLLDDPLLAPIAPLLPIIDLVQEQDDGDGASGEEALVQDERFLGGRLGMRYSRSQALWGRPSHFSGGLGIRLGLSGDTGTLGRSNESPIRRTARFRILDAEVSMRHQLPTDFALLSVLRLQRALKDRQVPQQHQWVLGGPDQLSAFLPGTLVGDSGSFASLQLQLPRGHFLGRPFRFAPFLEVGRAQFNDAEGDAGQTRSASAYGIKLEAAPVDAIRLTLHVADKISTSNLAEAFVDRSSTNVFFRIRGDW